MIRPYIRTYTSVRGVQEAQEAAILLGPKEIRVVAHGRFRVAGEIQNLVNRIVLRIQDCQIWVSHPDEPEPVQAELVPGKSELILTIWWY